MPDTLPVHVNREKLHSLEVPAAFETTGTFDVALENHGEALHVHLHLDDALSEVASIDASNHYVDAESSRIVTVSVDGDASRPVRGKLKVVSAYGAETRYVDVDVAEPPERREEVEVDESLSEPPPATDAPSEQPSSLLTNPEVLVLALGVVAVAVAAISALVVQSQAVLIGSLVVLGAVLVALYLLFQ
ncbi:MAG: hypothetical protein ABEI96_00375 [Haloarculaceae archaeon]